MTLAIDGSFRKGRMHYGIVAQYDGMTYEYWGVIQRGIMDHSSMNAEIWALVIGLEHVEKLHPTIDHLCIYSDCESMVDTLRYDAIWTAPYYLRLAYLKAAKLMGVWRGNISPATLYFTPRECNSWADELTRRDGYGFATTKNV